MTAALNFAFAAFTMTALALTIVGVASWRRARTPRLAVLAAGFAWFALAGLTGSAWLFTQDELAPLLTMHVALSSLGLLTIYLATVKRG